MLPNIILFITLKTMHTSIYTWILGFTRIYLQKYLQIYIYIYIYIYVYKYLYIHCIYVCIYIIYMYIYIYIYTYIYIYVCIYIYINLNINNYRTWMDEHAPFRSMIYPFSCQRLCRFALSISAPPAAPQWIGPSAYSSAIPPTAAARIHRRSL